MKASMNSLVGFVVVFGLVSLLPGSFAITYENVDQCPTLAEKGKYVDAGLCYYQFEVWDKCTYYLLKGAREAEKEWNFNEGPFSARAVALQYYGGAYTKSCIQNYGDYELLQKVDTYHEWLTYWLTSHANPPFDMDELLDGLHAKVFPETQPAQTGNETKPGVEENVSKPGKEVGGEVLGPSSGEETGTSAGAPSGPSGGGMPVWILVLGGAVVFALILVVVVGALLLRGRAKEKRTEEIAKDVVEEGKAEKGEKTS